MSDHLTSDSAQESATTHPVEPGQPADDPRVTQALEEYLAALEAGRGLDRQQLQARYPEIADRLGDYLEGLEFLHRTVADMHASSSDTPGDPDRAAAGGPAPALEDYQVLREVGRGGMGTVYEAVQRSLQRRVALKVLSLGATLDPRHLQRFKNEAQAAAQLQHPNIVPVFAVGYEQGLHYYAMRFIDGKTLRDLVRELRDGTAGTTPSAVRDAAFFRRVAALGVQTAEALEYAHQMGVIHRDIKPANLLLEDQGQLWVTDFGLARWPTDTALTMSGDLLGTLRYMSPEQASARRGLVDHRTDIYSLAATLYELVTLEPASRGEDHQELLHHILHEDPVPPRQLCRAVPRDLETILLKALSKSVEDRYATAQEMADDLRRFLDGQPVHARRPGWWERAGKWARRHRPTVAACLAVLLVSALGLAVSTILIGREQARTRAAYEQEARARQTEAEAREKEAEARTRAEENFRRAQHLLDYLAEIAAVDMAAEKDMPNVRRKLLRALLSQYREFLDQQNDNHWTREELLRGYTRVATLLDAIGRREDALAAWNRASRIALSFDDGRAVLRQVPVKSGLRLLRLASVQEELHLSPEQVRAVLELEAKRNEPVRSKQGDGQAARAGNDRAAALEKEALDLLTPEQTKRLSQLLTQQLGPLAFQDAKVSKSLELTAEQRQAIAAIQKAARATRPMGGAVGEQSDRAVMDRILELLTTEQRSRWQERVGEKFSGFLPPPEFVLSLQGNFVIVLTPGSCTSDQKQGPPEPDGTAP